MIDTAEYVSGPIVAVSGASLSTQIGKRPLPLGAVVGHNAAPVCDELGEVENEDTASFTARFESGLVGTFSVSRTAFGLPNGLGFDVSGLRGRAAFDQHRPAEYLFDDSPAGRPHRAAPGRSSPARSCPTSTAAYPMEAPGVGGGNAENFTYQARAFLDQVAGVADPLPGLRRPSPTRCARWRSSRPSSSPPATAAPPSTSRCPTTHAEKESWPSSSAPTPPACTTAPSPRPSTCCKANGLTSVEVNTGGFIPSPHCPVDLLLSSATAREEYLAAFADRGMELTGLNCNGNPLNPLPGVGPKHADDLRRTIRLAGLLGVKHVVTMSGTPGSDPDAKYPSWVVNPWDGVYMDVLDYQWGVAVEFWNEIDALARENDVRVAIEMHPHNLVFSPVTLQAARRRWSARPTSAPRWTPRT